MDLELAGKLAMIVGATSGIGLAIARAIHAEGAGLALVGRNRQSLEAARARIPQAGAGTTVHVADATRPAELRRAVGEACLRPPGLIAILVNCVSAPVVGAFEDHAAEDWSDAMNGKFLACVNAARACVPRMPDDGAGVIVNITGTGGRIYVQNHLAGGAANAALNLVTVGLARELAHRNIRVLAVSPGPTSTERFNLMLRSQSASAGADVADLRSRVESSTPTHRITAPADVADLVTFLASARARQINGTVITIDGGATPCT